MLLTGRRMRRLTLALLLCGCPAQPPVPAVCGEDDAGLPDAGPPDAGAPLEVLFIGNSYTAANDLPGMLKRLAGDALVTDSVTVGGATLLDHRVNAATLARIHERPWSHVVLQGQSWEPLFIIGASDFLTEAKRLGAEVADAGAQPVFFLTWARGPGSTEAYPATFADPDDMQDRLTDAYVLAAREVPRSAIACVGEAFRRSLRQYPELVLYDPDLSHPSVNGTYLAAATFYVSLLGRPVPADAEVPAGVSETDAARLREVALIGSACAATRIRSRVKVLDARHQDDAADAGPYDYETRTMPVTRLFLVVNDGPGTAELSDGMTLRPPFRWTTGAFPGGFGKATLFGEKDFCTGLLQPKRECIVSVTYDATADGTQTVGIAVADGYEPVVGRQVKGATTTRAHLTILDSSLCLQASCTDPAYVISPRGGTGEATFTIVNRGALTASSLAPLPLEPPFAWGAAADGGFPGTADRGCSGPLAPGAECRVVVQFSGPPDGGLFEGATLEVGYSDAMGSVGAARRRLAGFSF